MIEFRKIIAISLIFFQVSGCSLNRHAIRNTSAPSLSASDQNEVALGQQIHENIISRIPVSKDALASDYVTEIGESMVPFVKRKNLPYRFILLQDDRYYATYAPGGCVYVTTGLLTFLDNEAELAAVLAHEIGELQYRDPRLSQALKMVEKSIESGAMIVPVFGNIGAIAMIGLVLVHAGLDRTIGKGERLFRADNLAVRYAAAANYDPQGAIDLYYKMMQATPQQLMYLFDYHQSRPVTTDRLKHLEQAFRSLSLEGRNFDVNREHYLAMTKNLRQPVVSV